MLRASRLEVYGGSRKEKRRMAIVTKAGFAAPHARLPAYLDA
jgi:hypothetical protein